MFEIGGSLREARRRAGLELSGVSAATMIPARFLEAMEQDRFEVLPMGLYRRSFLREYASFLGLDGDVYAREYELRYEAPETDTEDVALPARTGGHLAEALSLLTPARAATAAVIALAGVGVWQLGTTGNAPSHASSPPRSHSSSTSAHTALQPTSPTHAARARHTSEAAATLTLRAQRGDCWILVQVGSASGRVVVEETLDPGEQLRLGLHRPLWIDLGAPWNLDATIGRRSVTAMLPQTTGEIVATRGGLQSASTQQRTRRPAIDVAVSNADAVSDNTTGYELMLAGRYTSALRFLRAAVGGLGAGGGTASPVAFYANFNLGQALVKLGRCGDALPYLSRAAELEPANAQARSALGYARSC